jgi:hypothetical protein
MLADVYHGLILLDFGTIVEAGDISTGVLEDDT